MRWLLGISLNRHKSITPTRQRMRERHKVNTDEKSVSSERASDWLSAYEIAWFTPSYHDTHNSTSDFRSAHKSRRRRQRVEWPAAAGQCKLICARPHTSTKLLPIHADTTRNTHNKSTIAAHSHSSGRANTLTPESMPLFITIIIWTIDATRGARFKLEIATVCSWSAIMSEPDEWHQI